MTRARVSEYAALLALLVGTAVTYLWRLGDNGWANGFYAAAVQSGTQSWKAFFFGSSDPLNSITVDKPPASLWLMELSGRIFGFHSWSMLVPQALLGVLSVLLLWACVRRYFGPVAGLIAATVMATTPVAVVMFRDNNPDALLVFLMIAAAWVMLRGVEDGRTRWLVLTGVFVGFGFLTKQLQVMLIVPALALVYVVAGPPSLGKRLVQLLAAGAAMVVSAGWWVAAVELWPASSRPWIGGSENNSILELTLGYNGIGRLNGQEGHGPGRPGGGPTPFSGDKGVLRLVADACGGQIGWLLPAALILLVVGVILCGKAARTDTARASLLLWGGWLLVTGLVFSFMSGIFHQYYTVALAPAVAALVGAGSALWWQHRDRLWVRAAGALAISGTAVMAWVLLVRTPSYLPWLKWVIAGAGVIALVGLMIRERVVLATALIVALAGPVAYSVDSVRTVEGHTGGMPMAGPRQPGMHGPFGGPPPPGDDRSPRRPGPFGGKPNPRVVAKLADTGDFAWAAATVSSMGAAGYQLESGKPVMPIGGFSGHDPSPTLEQFQQYVAQRRIHYFLDRDQAEGPVGPPPDGNSHGSQIQRWVREHYTSTTIGDVVLYDLASPIPVP